MHGISFLPTYRAISGPRQALPSGGHRRRVDAASGPCPAAHGDGDLRLRHERVRFDGRADRQGHSGLHWSPAENIEGPTASSARLPRTTTTPRSPLPAPGASPFSSGRRPGAISCRLQKRHLRFRHARQDHDDLNADAHFHAGQPRSHDHDRRLPAACSARGIASAKGDTIILESCEYCNSFLNFLPDRCGHSRRGRRSSGLFKDLQDVEQSFRKFASLVPADGLIVANGDDKNTRDTLAGMPYLSFGFDAKNDVYGKNFSEDFSEFDVFCGGQPYAHLWASLAVNALNALAACAVAWKFGISGETAAAALAEFHGAGRRLEYKGSFHGADVYDDYAHHPNELHALFAGCPADALPACDLRVPAAHVFAYEGAVPETLSTSCARPIRSFWPIFTPRVNRTPSVSARRIWPRRFPGAVYCPSLQGRDGLSARERPAGRYHPDRRRRRYLQGRRGAFTE